VATARERVVSFLHAELEWVATRGDDDAGGAWPERDGRVAGVLGRCGLLGCSTRMKPRPGGCGSVGGVWSGPSRLI
jgi:hypothetical protein